MIINLFKDISDTCQLLHVEEGQSIKDALPQIKDWSYTKIIVNGHFVESDHIIRHDDVISVRIIPGTKDLPTGWRIFWGIATLGISELVNIGIQSYENKKELQRMQDQVDKMKNSTRDGVVNIPTLKGATNSVSTGKTQPYLIGRSLITPYIMNSGNGSYKGFHTISGTTGEREFYNVVFECGFSDQILEKVYTDDIVIKNFDGDTPTTGHFALDSSVFASADSFLEVQQGDYTFEDQRFVNKIIETTPSERLEKHKRENDKARDLFYTLQPHSMAADIIILFNGLFGYNSDGDKVSASRTINTYYSLDYAKILEDKGDVSKATWRPIKYNFKGTMTNTFSARDTNQQRYQAHVDFDYDDVINLDTPITLKFSTPDYEPSSGSQYSDCYIKYIHSYVFDSVRSKNAGAFIAEKVIEDKESRLSTVLGLCIEATENNQDKLNKVQVVSKGVARTWDGSKWSEEKTYTSNPAAWLLEVLTSDTHTPSKILDDDIDLKSLGAWYEHCENNKLYCNYCITQGMTKGSIFDMICSCGRGAMYRNIYGKIAVAIDGVKENAIAVLNEQNLISFSYEKELPRKTDGLKITYTRADSWTQDTFIVMYDGSNPDTRSPDSVIRALNLDGVTSYEQSVREAFYRMKSEKIRNRKCKAEVGHEGLFFTPLSKVLVQHPSLKIGLGNAEIQGLIYNATNTEIIGLYLYDEVQLNTIDTFNVIIDCIGSYNGESYRTPLSKQIEGFSGLTDEIYFTDPILVSASVKPKPGNSLSYGYQIETVASEFLVSSITPTDYGYSLELVNYDVRIIDDSEEIPEYIPNITEPLSPVSQIPEGLPPASVEDLMSAVNGLVSGSSDIGAPDVPVMSATASRDGILLTVAPMADGLKNIITKVIWHVKRNEADEWELLTSSGSTDYTYSFRRTKDGYPEKETLNSWLFKCEVYNQSGNHTESEPVPVITTGYGTWKLTAPSILSRVSDRTVSLIITQSDRADNLETYGNIRYKVQIRKPSVDGEGTFYKPATALDPYASEDNYKDGQGYVVADGVYTQTLPLSGQDTNSISDTLYQFSVVAFNEASESEATIINATAVCTSIRDLVKANETSKEAYISNLTALCSSFGFISSGITDGKVTDDSNYWTLNSGLVENNEFNRAYKGAFRIGGDDQYLLVVPQVLNGIITGYQIDFKVGNFNVTSTATNFDGEFMVQDSSSPLDRIKISPKGLFLQHRDSNRGAWYTVNQFDTSGVIAPSLKSDRQMILGNFSQELARQSGHDIGRPYLTDKALVWHFDDNFFSQNGRTDGLLLDGSYMLKGTSDSSGIDFTPAIHAVAPYCTVARCCYGQYKADFTIENTQTATVDFWQQYLYAESQELFNIGTFNDKIVCQVLPSEVEAVTSGVCIWKDSKNKYLYTSRRHPKAEDFVYKTQAEAEQAAESDYIITSVTYNEDWTVASITVDDVVYTFDSGDAEANWETFAPEELWGGTSCIAVRADNKKTAIRHIGQISEEEFYLDDKGYRFNEYEWQHIGVVFTANKIKFLFNDFSYEFDRYSTASDDIAVSLNSWKTSVILDEIYIDVAAELTTDFIKQSSNRIPWAKLDKDFNWLIFDAYDVSKVRSNILDYYLNQFLNSDELKAKIQEITNK